MWARDNKVKRLKIDNIEVEISDIAFIDGFNMQTPQSQDLNTEIAQPEGSKPDKFGRPEDDPDLYHSVTN